MHTWIVFHEEPSGSWYCRVVPHMKECDVTVLLPQRHEECVEQIKQLRQVVQVCCVDESPCLIRSVVLRVSEVPHITDMHESEDPEVGIHENLKK